MRNRILTGFLEALELATLSPTQATPEAPQAQNEWDRLLAEIVERPKRLTERKQQHPPLPWPGSLTRRVQFERSTTLSQTGQTKSIIRREISPQQRN